MDKLIYSVKEVFSDFLRKELTGYYNIPEYQRGYKWNDAVLGYCAGIMLAASTLGLIVPAFEQR